MKTPLLSSRALAGLASAALAFLFVCAPARAFGQGQGQGKHGKDEGDDDVGTLPACAEQDPPSLVLVGSLHELQDVVVDVHGTGKLSLRLTPGFCSDGMSDALYAWSASVAGPPDLQLKGCGFRGSEAR